MVLSKTSAKGISFKWQQREISSTDAKDKSFHNKSV